VRRWPAVASEEKLESQVKILANAGKEIIQFCIAISCMPRLKGINKRTKWLLADTQQGPGAFLRPTMTVQSIGQSAVVTESLYQLEETMGGLRDYRENDGFRNREVS